MSMEIFYFEVSSINQNGYLRDENDSITDVSVNTFALKDQSWHNYFSQKIVKKM